jgi:four helix bundle protein
LVNRKELVGGLIKNHQSKTKNVEAAVMTEEDLKRRTKQFGLRALRLVDALPKSIGCRTVANQLASCATSVGANYRAACRARSRADFISKLGIVEEEADESAFWLELIMEGTMLAKNRVLLLHQEATEITKIIQASRMTAMQRSAAQRVVNKQERWPPNQKSPIKNQK